MNKKPLVSIITVSFNSEKEIRKTIESVLGQTYENIEYIVVDGDSSDATVPIACEYERSFAERGIYYKIFSEPDNGIYDAMNKGIAKVKGDIIGIINCGDWYEENAVEIVVNNKAKTDFDYFFADINIIKNDGNVFVKHSKKDVWATSHHWNHPSCFVTKEIYDELGLFICEGIHDDFDFYLRVRKANKRIEIENRVIANFIMGGVSNEKSWKKSKTRIHDRFECYKRNGYSKLYWLECVSIEMVKCFLG